jgi:hypothetical protein
MSEKSTVSGNSCMTTPSPSSESHHESLVQVTLLDNGVYVFTFKSSTRAAVDEYFALLKQVHLNNESKSLMRYVIDGREITVNGRTQMPPLGYSMQQMREMIVQIGEARPSRVAIVADGPFANVLDMMSKLVRGNGVAHMFKCAEFDEAVEWTLGTGR